VDSPAAYEARRLYTEMEMFIPVEYTVAAVTDFLAFQDSVRSQLPPGAENLLYNQVCLRAALLGFSVVVWRYSHDNQTETVALSVIQFPSAFYLAAHSSVLPKRRRL